MEQQQLSPNFNSCAQNQKSSTLNVLLNQSTIFLNTLYEKATISTKPTPYSCNTHYQNIYQPVPCQQNSISQPFISSSVTLKENICQVDYRNHEKSLQKTNFNKNYIKQTHKKWKRQSKEHMKLAAKFVDTIKYPNNAQTNIYRKQNEKSSLFNQNYPNIEIASSSSKLDVQSFDINKISTDNIFQILQQQKLNERELSINNLNRREVVALNLKLKNILLIKYHLNQIAQTRANRVIPKNFDKLCKIQRKKDLKMKQLIIRKLHKVLWKKIQNSGLQPEQKYKKTLKLISEIEQAHGKQSLQFQKSFIQFIRKINDKYPIKNSYLQNYLNSQSALAQKAIICDQTISIKDYFQLKKNGLNHVRQIFSTD